MQSFKERALTQLYSRFLSARDRALTKLWKGVFQTTEFLIMRAPKKYTSGDNVSLAEAYKNLRFLRKMFERDRHGHLVYPLNHPKADEMFEMWSRIGISDFPLHRDFSKITGRGYKRPKFSRLLDTPINELDEQRLWD